MVMWSRDGSVSDHVMEPVIDVVCNRKGSVIEIMGDLLKG